VKADLSQANSLGAVSALQAVSVSKRYDGADHDALRSISLDVKQGEFYSFLGPSGCGKTTLLRIFAGFEEPCSGQVLVAGKDVLGVPPYKRPVNMVFQSYALFPHMSVLENVAFGLRAAARLNKSDIIQQAMEALGTVRLVEMADRLPAQLSGGQQQRVALARALVMRPVVLLLDEPLSALDVRIREEMQEELLRLHRQLNLTFVMVTHDQSEALALSTRIAVFNKGNLEQVGSPEDVYGNPLTPFTATFIGRSNILPVLVKSVEQDSLIVELGSLLLRAARSPSSASVQSGEKAFLCFKPEACKVVPADVGASEANQLPCALLSRSYQGSLVDAKLKISGGEENIRAVFPAQQAAQLADGEKIVLQMDVAALSVLPGADPVAQPQPVAHG
jgi:spermidine/putrescine transport system ATP-binding protein